MSQIKPIAILILLALTPFLMAQEPTTLRTGDLLFQGGQASAFEQAIASATGSYTHVALVERDAEGRLYVIEAVPREGVRRVALTAAWGPYDAYRPECELDTAALLRRAHARIGQPYDHAFMADNGALYCSELIYECYRRSDGQPLFEAQPMNFRDGRGRLPRYWRRHFRRLHMAVPEGMPGTNPTDLARSPLLRRLGQ